MQYSSGVKTPGECTVQAKIAARYPDRHTAREELSRNGIVSHVNCSHAHASRELAHDSMLNAKESPLMNRSILLIKMPWPSFESDSFGTISIVARVVVNVPNNCASQGNSCVADSEPNVLDEAYALQSKLHWPLHLRNYA